jgi:anti-sigma B factor antagonist
MDLRIDRSGPYPTAWLTGEIRAEDSDRFVQELHPLVAEAGAKVAVDLSGVIWLDSTGLTALINVVTRARLSGARAILVGPTQFVAGVFEVTNLASWFEIVPDHDEAARLLTNAGG